MQVELQLTICQIYLLVGLAKTQH